MSPRTPRPQGLITKMYFSTMLHTSCTMGTSPLPHVFLTPGSSPKEPLPGAGHFRWQKENRVDELCDVSERFPLGVFVCHFLAQSIGQSKPCGQGASQRGRRRTLLLQRGHCKSQGTKSAALPGKVSEELGQRY